MSVIHESSPGSDRERNPLRIESICGKVENVYIGFKKEYSEMCRNDIEALLKGL